MLIDVDSWWLPQRLHGETAVVVKTNHAGVTFDEELSEGVSGIGRERFVIAVGIPQTDGAVLEFEVQNACVFSGDRGVQSSEPGKDLAHLAHEKPEDVDEVHTGFEHQQLRHRSKVRLSRQIRVRSPPVAHSRSDRDRVWTSDNARLQQQSKLAMPGLESEVVVDHEANAVGRSPRHDGLRLTERRRKGLLADDVDATLTGQRAQRLVRVRWRDDVDKIRSLPIEHFLRIAVDSRDAESCGDPFSAGT